MKKILVLIVGCLMFVACDSKKEVTTGKDSVTVSDTVKVDTLKKLK